MRDVTRRTLVVTNLRTTRMMIPGRKIHVIVTCAAGGSAGSCKIIRCLGRALILLVAGLATTRVGWMNNGRPIENRSAKPDNLIRLTGLHARQAASHVDLVSHHRKVDRVTRIGINSLRCVAKNAQLNATPGSA